MFSSRIILNPVESEWVLLIHGFGGSSNTWQRQIEAYSQKFNLLLLDMHDRADMPGAGSQLTIDGVCAAIAETMDHHNVPRAHVVSLSLGTMLAISFAVQYPRRVISMVMAGGVIRFNEIGRAHV